MQSFDIVGDGNLLLRFLIWRLSASSDSGFVFILPDITSLCVAEQLMQYRAGLLISSRF